MADETNDDIEFEPTEGDSTPEKPPADDSQGAGPDSEPVPEGPKTAGADTQTEPSDAEPGPEGQASADTDSDPKSDSHVRGNLSFVGGILGGGLAYVIGVVLTGGLFILGIGDRSAGDLVQDSAAGAVAVYDPAESLQTFITVLSMPFYNAHGVPIRVESGSESETVNLILAFTLDGTGYELNILLFALIPAVLLFVFGGLVALLKRADGFLGGIISGSSVIMGYLPLVVAGALFFQRDSPQVEASVQLLPAIFLAGIIFPLVFGGLAGLVKILFINVFIGGIRARL